MGVYEKNLGALEKIDRELYNRILNLTVDEKRYCLIQAKNGDYTVKVSTFEGDRRVEFYLHSKYDPQKEAMNFIQSQFEDKSNMTILYGFGLGYCAEKLIENLGDSQVLYIIETNLQIFKLALQVKDLSSVFEDSRVKLVISDEGSIIKNFSSFLNQDASFLMYSPSVKAIPEKIERFKLVLEQWKLKRHISDRLGSTLWKNYYDNIKLGCQNIGTLFNKLKDVPVVVVSAGPSLNKNKHLLKDLKGKALIFAAGAALKPLLQVGIEPDILCIIDPLPITYAQIAGCEDLNIPLVFLDTACALTVSAYEGPKFITCNDEDRIENKAYLINTGGSVATAVMDIAIKFGGNPIVFVGQDLALSGNEHHAMGNMYGGEEKVKSLPNMRRVKGQNGEWLDTTAGYLGFKSWIEGKIRDNSHVEFINATEGGVHIEGCRHMKLQDFIDSYISNTDLVNKNESLLKEFMEMILEKATYDKRNEIKALTFKILLE